MNSGQSDSAPGDDANCTPTDLGAEHSSEPSDCELAPPDWEGEALDWVYLDDTGRMQGPFSTEDMRAWLNAGFLQFDRLGGVAGMEEADLLPLASFPELGDAVNLPDKNEEAVGVDRTVLGDGVAAGEIEEESEPHRHAMARCCRSVAPTGGGSSTVAAAATARAAEETSVQTGARVAQACAAFGPSPQGAQPPAASTKPPTLCTAPCPAPTAAEEAPALWYYIDDAGVERGPFPTSRMGRWIARGIFLASRLVRRDIEPQLAFASADASEVVAMFATSTGSQVRSAEAEVTISSTEAAPSASELAASAAEATQMRPIADWHELAAFLPSKPVQVAPNSTSTTRNHGCEQPGSVASCPSCAGCSPQACEGTRACCTCGSPSGEHGSVAVAVSQDELSLTEASSLWEYWDDRGRIQGPFSAAKIVHWIRAGHLKPTRMVRPHIPAEGRATTSSLLPSAHLCAGAQFSALHETTPFDRVLSSTSSSTPPPPAVLPSINTGGGEAPSWYYIDAAGAQQGPFTATLVQQWFTAGMIPPTTLVRHLSEASSASRPLASVPLLTGNALRAAADIHTAGLGSAALRSDEIYSTDPSGAWASSTAHLNAGTGHDGATMGTCGMLPAQPLHRPQYEEYVTVGSFNARTGKFTAEHLAGEQYWSAKGLPTDRAGRQMAHYFDHERWQQQMNERKAKAAKKATGRR
eukprot:scaffold87404_cov32-Tisochrysis_lutea.AAC.1